MQAFRHAPWTRAEVERLIAESPLATPRYELVDGELFVTPSPGRAHQRAVARMYLALHAYVETHRLGGLYFSPSDTEPEPGTLVQPDLYVVPPEEERDLEARVRRMTLAVEVLSPGSARGDRGRKRLLYQRTVPEYWIVDLDARLVERWRPGDERPEVVRGALTWRPEGVAEPLRVDVEELFRRVWGDS